MKKLVLAAVIFTLFAGFSLYAKFQGPGNVEDVTTVAEAKKARDDVKVVLTGNIVKQVDDDDYLFKDSTGEIEIDIDYDKIEDMDITPDTTIKIYGDVDEYDGVVGTGLWSTNKIDVDRVDVVSEPDKQS